MALVVEDGTGLSTAESFCSVAFADTRHTALGNTAWTGATAVKESALRVATEYMEQSYRQRWKGEKLTRDQALSWPRWGAVVDGWELASDEVPDAVANACADLAMKSLSETLNPDLTQGIVREKVGPLEVEYNLHSPQATRYRAVDMGLAAFLNGSSHTAMLVRA